MIAALSNLKLTQSVIAVAVARRRVWPLRQTLAKKVALPMKGHDRFLPQHRYHTELDLTVLDVKDRICCVSLRENLPTLSIFRHRPAAVYGVEKQLDVKGSLARRPSH